jgi:hypothetical protein
MKNWGELCLKSDKEIKQLWNMLNRIWDEEEFIVKHRSDGFESIYSCDIYSRATSLGANEYFAEMVYSQMRKRNLKM